jgi:hypothetical protein
LLPRFGRRVFHSGQWGVDFNIGSGFVGAGVIHFRSPTRALVLNLSGGLSTSTSATGNSISGNVVQANVSLGARRYHPFAPRLYFYRTLGIEGNYRHSFIGGATDLTENDWSGGLFGEVGAGWLVTPHLAVGATWRFSADYGGGEVRQPGVLTGKSHGFSFTLGEVRLTGQLYF